MSGPGAGALSVTPETLPLLVSAVAATASALGTAHGLLTGAGDTVRQHAAATEPAAAVAAGLAVSEVRDGLDPLLATLVRLGRALGAADTVLTAVEAGLSRVPPAGAHPSALGRALHLVDLAVTLEVERRLAHVPRAVSLAVTGLARLGAAGLLPRRAGDAVPLPPDADPVPGGDTTATSFAGWLGRVDSVAGGQGHVAVTDVGRGAWVVQLPGIHTVLPTPDPLDLPGAVTALATGSGAYVRGVRLALERAGVPAGARLLLVGHSEGGIVATDLARDPDVVRRWHVTHVLVVGAPVSRSEVGPGTRLLEVVNDSDVVPTLDASTSTRRHAVVTFRRERGDIGRNHDLGDTYVPFVASRDFTQSPQARAFTVGAEDYLRPGGARTTVFALYDAPPVLLAPGPVPPRVE